VDLLETKFAELLFKRDDYDQWLQLHKTKDNNNFSIKLSNINYLIFPDWQSDEETLTEELYNLISKLAHNSPLIKENTSVSDSPLIKGGGRGSTLVIDCTGITEEDANLIVSGIAMNLMMKEELDLENTLDFALINNLSR